MKIACVGAHGSNMDYGILLEALTLLETPFETALHIDMVDLRNGRNFLKESLTYDAVTLNYIFVLSPTEFAKECRAIPIRDYPDFKTSDLHAPGSWRQRLMQTGAREILIFGFSSHGEVTGNYIGELPGYKLKYVKTARGSIWHYAKR